MKRKATLPVLFLMAAVIAVTSIAVHPQSGSGRLSGKVVDAEGKPLAGVTVVVTNQTTTQTMTTRSSQDGGFSIRLRNGAYRVTVRSPFEARFKRGNAEEYGAYSNVICDESKKKCLILENVIMEGSDRKLEIVAVDPAKETAAPAEGAEKASTMPDRREVRDRWRYEFPEYDRYGDRGARGRDIPFKRGKWYNPYDQNTLKGDRPVIGDDYFVILSAVSTTQAELRRTPSGNNVSTANPNSNNFFGRPESFSFNQTIQVSFEFFKGQTTFKPRTWALKMSPTFSVPNYLNARENGIVNVDVRRGTTRTETHVSLEEAFAEVKLFDTNKNYDSVSVRAGIQPFNADFRGFLYTDNNLGARIFGAFSNNKTQFNLTYFRQIEKDTNSNLNSMRSLRPQNVYIANLYRQDFLRKGYTIQAVAAYNDDRADIHYDRNGFLVRPALVGSARKHNVKAGYIGINGDGHIGVLNITNSYYFAFGRDDFNPIAGKKTSIRAHMAAVEASVDKNWLRFKTSAFFASGDKDPTDDKATGFDAILDDPNFAGGQFSYWSRQGIRLVSTEIGLVQPNSLLPSLRGSKTEGQANFVNPGIFILNAGVDAELTQTIKTVFNANYLRFHRTESLEYVLFQPGVRKPIGFDLSLGAVYRPLLINNITFTFGGSIFFAGRGFRDIYTDRSRNCPIPNFCSGEIPNPSKPQYSLFSQVKLIF
jgi:hypothetical protein